MLDSIPKLSQKTDDSYKAASISSAPSHSNLPFATEAKGSRATTNAYLSQAKAKNTKFEANAAPITSSGPSLQP